MLLSSACPKQGVLSLSGCASQELPKELGGTTARRADPDWPKGHSRAKDMEPSTETGVGQELSITVCRQAGHHSATRLAITWFSWLLFSPPLLQLLLLSLASLYYIYNIYIHTIFYFVSIKLFLSPLTGIDCQLGLNHYNKPEIIFPFLFLKATKNYWWWVWNTTFQSVKEWVYIWKKQTAFPPATHWGLGHSYSTQGSSEFFRHWS